MTSRIISNVLPTLPDESQLHKAIRSWIFSLVIFGGLSIFSHSTLDPVWGIVMSSIVLAGLLCAYFVGAISSLATQQGVLPGEV